MKQRGRTFQGVRTPAKPRALEAEGKRKRFKEFIVVACGLLGLKQVYSKVVFDGHISALPTRPCAFLSSLLLICPHRYDCQPPRFMDLWITSDAAFSEPEKNQTLKAIPWKL